MANNAQEEILKSGEYLSRIIEAVKNDTSNKENYESQKIQSQSAQD